MIRRVLRDPKTWWWIAAALFGIVISGPLGNRIWNWPNVWPIAGAALLATLIIAVWRHRVDQGERKKAANVQYFREQRERKVQMQQHFALCKPAGGLRPAQWRP